LASALADRKLPLWQVEQLPAASGPVVPVWLIVGPVKEVNTLWQTSHCAVVGMWMVGLPSAVLPLWQVAQRPATAGTAVAWLKVAVAQLVVELWQVSHCAVVTMCVGGLASAFCAR
jgi:hypothetical protein